MVEMAAVAQQLAESVQGGRVIELGQPLRQGMPHHPMHPPFVFSLSRQHGDIVVDGFSSANDTFSMGGHTGTHIDALGHVSDNDRIYGDFDAKDHQDVRGGLKTHDIASLPPVIGRGVLLDVATYKGQAHLPAGYGVSADDLEATAKRQDVSVERGDVVLVRTGWTHVYDNDPGRYSAPSAEPPPGVGLEAAEWLVERGIRATGADTAPYEIRVPGLPVHRFLLVRSGVPIMENLNLDAAAQQQAYTFLFVALPLRIVGGTGSPIRPVAVV